MDGKSSWMRVALTIVIDWRFAMAFSSWRYFCSSQTPEGPFTLSFRDQPKYAPLQMRGAHFLPVLDELPALQLVHRQLQFCLRIHHDRPIPGHRLFQRLA